MKTKILSLIALVSVVFTSCDTELLDVKFPYKQKISVLVPAATDADQELKLVQNVSLSGMVNFLNEKKVGQGILKDITLDKLTLTITDTDKTFDFLKSVDVYLATSETGENKTLLVSASEVSPTDKTLNLKTTNASTTKLIYDENWKARENLYLIFEGKSAKATVDAINMDAEMEFTIVAKTI